MKNVKFSYPGGKSDGNALHDISFSIKPGQLVVIVGPNGSGKSTLLKLLTRLFDCTSGQVLVNEEDIRECKLSDLRSATAVLAQDYQIFPLSLAENIGMGNPEVVADQKLIQDSARKGGADTFISKRVDKYSTVLEPKAIHLLGQAAFKGDGSEIAQIYCNSKEEKEEISGGEQQRVAASRTFMRLTCGEVKLIIADEPSSNLDPRGESEMFRNLLNERQGKTMIFVTHRFGHLTKQADLILCMKDGHLVEQGTHDKLMEIRGENGERGEYCKLYEIQARPFTDV
ncbi:P-loop containing nucleoside triphosphate hydrolase protein [Mycena alexandri]|uniref:P-loop containing nucleoside triphosphate hydrolase protein n=1 Tax=Mycena alexandri TaxID=1745969 RepID=A0AAD6TBD7_9AGAR|nr:P-loop containing nucleoside triphosphate hydrolase protein [Mycena alexandri]